jgi:hypothetical protein
MIVTVEAQTSTDTVKTQSASDTVKMAKTFRHELLLYGAGGASMLKYSLAKDGGKTDGANNIVLTAGLGYTWNINEHIGIVTGLEITEYESKAEYSAISGDRDYGVTEKNRFNFGYSITGYIEEQDFILLSVPVMAQYNFPMSGSIVSYLSGGLKIGYPVQAKATISSTAINTFGHYYYENQTYTGLPQYGFITNNKSASMERDIDTNISVALSLEAGLKFLLLDKILLYSGIYFDYGLNSLRSEKEMQLINYQELNPSDLRYGSILNTSFVDDVRLFGIGLKLRLSLFAR